MMVYYLLLFLAFQWKAWRKFNLNDGWKIWILPRHSICIDLNVRANFYPAVAKISSWAVPATDVLIQHELAGIISHFYFCQCAWKMPSLSGLGDEWSGWKQGKSTQHRYSTARWCPPKWKINFPWVHSSIGKASSNFQLNLEYQQRFCGNLRFVPSHYEYHN